MCRKNWMAGLFAACLWASALNGWAAIEVRQFANQQQQAAYERLIEELRCLVCQNENLADSNAELARDLRDEVYAMLTQQGLDEQAVKAYLVQRYGDFVLYRPPLKASTWLLWTGPFLMLLIGAGIGWKVLRNHRAPSGDGRPETDVRGRDEACRLLEEK